MFGNREMNRNDEPSHLTLIKSIVCRIVFVYSTQTYENERRKHKCRRISPNRGNAQCKLHQCVRMFISCVVSLGKAKEKKYRVRTTIR